MTLLELDWDAWIALAVVVGVTVGMVRERLGPDLVMFSGLCVLVVTGVLDLERALAGFSETAVLTIGVLFVCAAAMEETGALRTIGKRLFGRTRDPTVALLRLTLPTAAMSAFMNNTPIVAMFIPLVRQFAFSIGIAPSQLLIPLAYAAMFGGTCTLIGTSSNLIVSSQLERSGLATLGMLEIGMIGVPSSLLGIAYLALVGRRLLPDHKDPLASAVEEARHFLAEVEVREGASIIGKKVGSAGLRSLDGLFLLAIQRSDGHLVRPVGPHDRILAGDRLLFRGDAPKIGGLLERIPGLAPAGEVQLGERGLYEVVLAHRSPFVGRTVKEADFRRRVDAAIVAIHRAGERLEGQIGDVVLQPGDTLLLLASPGFYRAFRNSDLFYVISSIPAAPPSSSREARLTLLTLLGLVLLPAVLGIPMLVAAMGALLILLLGIRAVSPRTARASVNGGVLVLIGSAFGIAEALESTGAAAAMGHALLGLTEPYGPRVTLGAVYLSGVLFASFISNAAAAALLFPVAATAADVAHADIRPFAIALAMAASAGFSTPIGCQPNLLVYGPGGYRYTDFLRVGLPLNLLFAVTAIVGIPWIWPF